MHVSKLENQFSLADVLFAITLAVLMFVYLRCVAPDNNPLALLQPLFVAALLSVLLFPERLFWESQKSMGGLVVEAILWSPSVYSFILLYA